MVTWRVDPGRLAVLCLALLVGACAPRFALPGPAVEAPRLAAESAVMADGETLPMRVWPAEGNVKAVLLALHGFNDYSAFIDKAARYFAARGIEVYAYDQRGFGDAPVRGRWPGRQAFAHDLRAVARLVAARHPGVPLYLLGESMGGAVILTAEAEGPRVAADGVILAAPAVWGRETMPFYQRWALAVAAHTVPWVTLTGRGIKRHPSDNIPMLKALGRDPKVIKRTRIDTLYGLANLMDAALADASKFRARALILRGEHDDIVPEKPAELMISRLPAEARDRQRVARYPKGYHMLLRDLQAETVWNDIAHWIAAPDAPLPSAADKPRPVVTR